MNVCLRALLCLLVLLLSSSAAHSESPNIRIDSSGGKFIVRFGGQLFTELDISHYRRPILYPVLGPGGTPMTRNHPMKKGVEGEASDHPHHKSIWCGHGLINGVSFWSEEGQIKVDTSEPIRVLIDSDGQSGSISYHANYLAADAHVVCTDKTTISFRRISADVMAIDWDLTIHASEGDLRFGDTKEGMMAIRTHPSLRIDKGATGRNSNGDEGKGIWGKRAAWVNYSGDVEGHEVGVAIFDHPTNLRHPTTWHARDYGLVAANPFGLSHFQDKPKGAGDFEVKQGDSVRFQYRFVFHSGNVTDAKVAELYDSYKK